MTAPHGDSTDGFVFPPFVPTSSRPADAPAPPPASEQPPAPAPAPAESAGRMTMPWDVETPVVRDGDEAVAAGARSGAETETEGEDLPWLEVPTPREEVSASAEPPADAPAAAEAFPDWMAWNAQDEAEAEAEARGVAPVPGLEDAEAVGGFDAPTAPAADGGAVGDLGAGDLGLELAPEFEAPGGWERAPEPEAAGEGGADELALEFAPEFDTPGGFEPAAEPPTGEEEEDGRAAYESPAAAAAEAESAFPEPEPVPADTAAPDDFTSAAIAAAEAETPADPVPADEAAPGVFDEVAGRLEDIARTLRDRPDALLTGTGSDPLALLVAGFVLGYRQGRG